MQADPHLIIGELIDRITAIAVRAYEVESLLAPGARHRFRRTAHEVVSVSQASPVLIEFACQLTLQAEGENGERVPHAYLVAVTGFAGYEQAIWYVNDITDVVADRVDRGDHSGFAPL